MPNLADRIRAAQIHAGEQAVLDDLRARGLAAETKDERIQRLRDERDAHQERARQITHELEDLGIGGY